MKRSKTVQRIRDIAAEVVDVRLSAPPPDDILNGSPDERRAYFEDILAEAREKLLAAVEGKLSEPDVWPEMMTALERCAWECGGRWSWTEAFVAQQLAGRP